MAAAHGPIAIEATGYTLEEIEARDPNWLARLRDLIAGGKVEFVGSGYAQLIGPLVPATGGRGQSQDRHTRSISVCSRCNRRSRW